MQNAVQTTSSVTGNSTQGKNPKHAKSAIIARRGLEDTNITFSKDGGTGASDNGDSPVYGRKEELREQKSGLLANPNSGSMNMPAE